MSELRLNALQKTKKNTIHLNGKGHLNEKISDIFSQNVFGLSAMKDYLTESAYYAIISAHKNRTRIDSTVAEHVAKGMKKWAMDQGVTHYTHWFQPLTGLTAEKHDAFYKPSLDINGKGIESLTGRELLQREPDASSFPTGGLRNTSAARGYTIWDPTSPAFILELESGKTLYVPSVFVSYTGESLGNKAPVLKSIEALNKAASPICQYFDSEVKSIFPTLGWEQEYFLVDETLYEARPDLMLTGRTLFGHSSAKGQECDDHYFGAIPDRVQKFMHEFESESLKLGIPVLTRHNEVAPSQYECAPMYEELNVSVDHNLLVMDTLHRVAKKHGLKALLHEKPFGGLNGSGKHNNWSMATNTGSNLLAPGKKPSTNLKFLTFFVNVIKAVEVHADVLRASIATPGNDHRLGANEAPPAIISVFIGDTLSTILKNFKLNGLEKDGQLVDLPMELDIPGIPEALLDNSDRNRTSPFPFVGNRFEFRGVGSEASCSFPMTVLNTIVAEQLTLFKQDVEALKAKGKEEQDAIVSVLQQYIKESERIIFNGDGYSKEWEKEAAKRGLANIKTTPYALDILHSQKTKLLFENHGVLSSEELEARYEVLQEFYVNKIRTEAELLKELTHTHILPAALDQQDKLISLYSGYKEMGLTKAAEGMKAQVEKLSGHTQNVNLNIEKLEKAILKAESAKDVVKMSKCYSDSVTPLFDAIRTDTDALEVLVDDSSWKLPKYRELLFIK
ncbi:MAG: glutamine synthetase type III [Flavobacteriales bacterium]|nr:MAG: glutamine synthetase type III [Flavobacteriales bacterium]